ncbi:class I SAM-dependent methyltransferase [Roseibium album]|uniref:class I SAM-dependent methyltransferase n=1 Tax=Roseibium album TaxID=311410 RepID=UPI0024920F26|nr:class I SAM-dependent methyltransferase [Roseibium album]
MKDTSSYESYLKSPYRSIKHSTYFDSYDHFLGQYRDKEITFVEIGILGGGSLFMWRDFFGPKARIIGVDLNPNAKKWEDDGFEIFIGNQSDANFWNEFKAKVGNIDVVLDDGGHTYEQQIITLECLLDSINDGGLILIEDTHTSYMDGFGPQKYSFLEYVKNRIDAVNRRFRRFAKDNCERRFWSVEIVESMVAFKIRTAASALASEPTDNGGEDDLAYDFRYEDNSSIKKFKPLWKSLSFLMSIPVLKNLALGLRNKIANRKFSAGKYLN